MRDGVATEFPAEMDQGGEAMPASEAGELRESRTICSWSGDPGEGGSMDEDFANVLGGVSRLARRSPS
ncbi:MAG: hypothetical protein ACP5ID_06750, partial [Conexivisphaera sp.]